MNKDLVNNIGITMLKEPVDCVHSDWKSNLLDLQGHESAVLIVTIGALTGVDGSNKITLTLEECDTTADASFTTVSASDVEGAFTLVDANTEDQLNQSVGYKGTKRYVRVKGVYTGAGISAGIIGVNGIVSNSRSGCPVTNPAPVSAT